jgi:hypothetical protein
VGCVETRPENLGAHHVEAYADGEAEAPHELAER